MRIGVPYFRVSTNQQGESKLGLEAQQQAVFQYALSNQINITEQFVEIESGKKNRRPILQQALFYCQKHKAQLLIAKLDRLGRNVAFIATLMDSKVDFVAVDNPHATPLMLHIMAAFAQYEREQISLRTKEALAAAKRRGTKLGEHGKTLAGRNKYRAEQFAQQVKPIIENLIIEGHKSVRKITIELNRRKIPTYRKGAKWHKTTVYHLLVRYRMIKSLGNSNVQTL